MGSSRWDVVVGLKYSKWSLANQTSVVLFLDSRQFCMAKTYVARQSSYLGTRTCTRSSTYMYVTGIWVYLGRSSTPLGTRTFSTGI